jgi:hypothetical protein
METTNIHTCLHSLYATEPSAHPKAGIHTLDYKTASTQAIYFSNCRYYKEQTPIQATDCECK